MFFWEIENSRGVFIVCFVYKECWDGIMVEDEKLIIVKRVKKEEGNKKDVNFSDEVLVNLFVKDLNFFL